MANEENKPTAPSHGKWHGGKGSARKESDQKKYEDGWDRIFGKKDNKDKK